MTLKSYYQAHQVEEGEMTPFARTATTTAGHHQTAMKRQHSATHQPDEPNCKERITEEKMAARLRSFHITPRPEQANHWFFMRPQETFQQIEQRLADSDDEEDMEDGEKRTEETGITLSPELNELIQKQHKAFGPSIRQPKNDMQVVIWTPREDFVQEVVNKAVGPRITELVDDGEELDDHDAPLQTQIVTFPDVEDVDTADISVRRRRKSPSRPDRQRYSSTLNIEEMSDESDDSPKEMECDE